MRNFKTEGIIIKRRNYKDHDRILTILTKTNGKIYVKASGVRKITSRRAGHIELINHSIISLYQGNSYPILTEAETINNFNSLKSNLQSVGYAMHLCELVDGLCPENQENNRVFILLRDTLIKLSTSEDKKSIVNEFEMQLLSVLGYWNKANFAQAFDSDKVGVDTQSFIEDILERRLKSRSIFSKLN